MAINYGAITLTALCCADCNKQGNGRNAYAVFGGFAQANVSASQQARNALIGTAHLKSPAHVKSSDHHCQEIRNIFDEKYPMSRGRRR